MQDFQPAKLDLPPCTEWVDSIMAEMQTLGITRERAVALYHSLEQEQVWLNDQYQVNVRQVTGFNMPVTHLSIKRRYREAIRDWRDMQEIKNKLCGPECEAVELYPAESRLVDTANQYHLWVLPQGIRFPVGWDQQLVINTSMAGAVQRPRGGA